jgi:hypothetical protein
MNIDSEKTPTAVASGSQRIVTMTRGYVQVHLLRFALINHLPKYEQAYQPAYPAEVPNGGVTGTLPTVPPGSENTLQAGPSTQPEAGEERPRGRKRTRTQVKN